jgi:hypothetical protein
LIANAQNTDNWGLSERMRPAFFFALAAFSLFYVVLLLHRLRLEDTKEQVEEVKERVGY